MTPDQFNTFISDAVDAVQQKNTQLAKRYNLGGFARWDYNGDLGHLIFSNPGDPKVLMARTTSLGSYAVQAKTWLWAWANDSLTDEERERAAALKGLHAKTGMDLFTDPGIGCDEPLAWGLAAASVQHLGGLGVYRGPMDDLWVFWSIDKITQGRRDS